VRLRGASSEHQLGGYPLTNVMKKNSEPHPPGNATVATIVRWGSDRLGVDYVLPGGARETHVLGPDDRLILDRLRRVGRVGYVDDDMRRRYLATLKQAGAVRS
jgi:hypothetical protein